MLGRWVFRIHWSGKGISWYCGLAGFLQQFSNYYLLVLIKDINASEINNLVTGFLWQDRVSLINGSKDSISDVVKLLVKLMKQRLDELGEPGDPTQQLRLVVPNSTIGMVIGKGGETVEQMKQRSGANILISKKDEVKIPERVITLVGEVRSNQVALDMILEKVGLPSLL